MADGNTKRIVMNCSWGDHLEAWDGDDAMDRPGRILRCAERWRREFGAGAVYWREMKTWSKFRICFSAPGAPPRRVFEDYERQDFDEHELITTRLREMGYKVYLYATMYDEGYLVNDEDHYGIKGVDDHGIPSYWSIPLVKGSPAYQGAMDRLYGAIRDDYGPHCARHGCRLLVARMWSVHDPEENARLLDTEGVSGLVIGSFGAAVDRRCGGVRPDVSPAA